MPTLELKLDGGASVFVSVKSPMPAKQGPDGDKREDVANTEEKLEQSFSKVSTSLKQIVESLESQLSTLVSRPDKVEIEMGVELKAGADLWLVSGEMTGHMLVTLAWEKPKPPNGGNGAASK